MGPVEWNLVGGLNGKEAWVSKENFHLGNGDNKRKWDEDTWVLLFTTTIEEGVDGHRYGDTFILSCPFSFKMKV